MVMADFGLSANDYVLVKESSKGYLSLNVDNESGKYGANPDEMVRFYVVPKSQAQGEEDGKPEGENPEGEKTEEEKQI